MSNEWLNTLDEAVKSDSGSGKGTICQVDVLSGYKVFVKGMGNRESFIACNFSDKDASDKAKAKLKEFGEPKMSVALILLKGTVKSRETTWKDDQFKVYATWTKDYKEIVRPSLSLIPSLGRYWMRVGYKKNLSGLMEKGTDGEMRDTLIAFVSEVFPNEAAATAAAGPSANGSEGFGEGPVIDPNVPPGYDTQTWPANKSGIQESYNKFLQGITKGKKLPPKPMADAIAEAMRLTASEWEVEGHEEKVAKLIAS